VTLSSGKPQSALLQQAIDHFNILYSQGKFVEILQRARPLLEECPDSSMLRGIMGACMIARGKYDAAIELFKDGLEINPKSAETHNYIGAAYQAKKEYFEAITHYNRSLELDNGYALAYFNLGTVQNECGLAAESAENFEKASALEPQLSMAHDGLGIALQYMGELEKALNGFDRALEINPNNAETHMRRHAILLDLQGNEAAFVPLNTAVVKDPNNIGLRLSRDIFLDYCGEADEEIYSFYEEIKNHGAGKEIAKLDSWEYVKEAARNGALFFGSSITGFRLAMEAARKDGLVLEFGVRFGTSIRLISTLAQADVHGFDSFEGLPEDWGGLKKGVYSTQRRLPIVPDNVTLHEGWFEDTLPEFNKARKDKPVRFMNIDCDLYSATVTIFETFANQIGPGTVIVFDEYLVNDSWREDEYKAFQEAVEKYGWKYEYLGFSLYTKQAVVKII
jgi:tetratricopeptide (TPR) repeat protein